MAEENERTRKILQHRSYVLKELIESEREYVVRVRIAFQDYMNYIKNSGPEIPASLKADVLPIFSNLPEIYAFHCNVFLPALEGCNQEDADEVVGCFLKHNAEFKVYLPYCKNKPTSDKTRLEYDSFFNQRQSELGQKLNIEDLLIAPVQRLPKYQLLIKDLLKDAHKLDMNTAVVEEALEVMQKIPKETNNIICLSLLRGITRANILSHGSLWRQDTLTFSQVSAFNGTNNNKEEPMQVFLFDHQILIALPADTNSFFHFQTAIKTLNGKTVDGVDGDPLKFSFTSEDGIIYKFRCSSKEAAERWTADIKAILNSQSQMLKALVFGKPATPRVRPVRTPSINIDWSDSDSSIDSLPPSSPESSGEEWPETTGFHKISYSASPSPSPSASPLPTLSLPPSARKKAKKFSPEFRRVTLPDDVPHPSSIKRPHSFHAASLVEFAHQLQKERSNTLSVTSNTFRKFIKRKTGLSSEISIVYFPTSSSSSNPLRSPGATLKFPRTLSPEQVYYIAIENQPAIAEQLYSPPAGQVFLAEDTSRGDVWKAVVLSGDNVRDTVLIQRNSIEEYCASVAVEPMKKLYNVVNHISSGRFSDVKLVKSKTTKQTLALKILKEGTREVEFYRELCIGIRLKHRNLVHYRGGIQHRIMAFAMEYVNGRRLLDYLVRKSSVTETQVVSLIEQLLCGLEYLHSHTLVHLDVRPGNIMVHLSREEDIVKLIDYGAARHYGGTDDLLTQNFERSYNYEYVPPEVFVQVSVGPGTDIWGVGIIIYSLFHGATPFQGGSSVRTIANITSLEYYFPSPRSPACSQEAMQLMKAIFVRDPNGRPSAKAAKEYSWFKEKNSFSENKIDLVQLKQFLQRMG